MGPCRVGTRTGVVTDRAIPADVTDRVSAGNDVRVTPAGFPILPAIRSSALPPTSGQSPLP